MMFRKLIVGLVTVVPLAMLGGYLGARWALPSEALQAKARDGAATKTETVERVVVQHRIAVDDVDEPATNEPESEPPPEPAPKEPVDRRAAFRDLKAEVLAEPRDPNWARATEPRIREALETELNNRGEQAEIDKVECKSVRCVIELTTTTKSFHYSRFPYLMGLGLGRVTTERLPDGKTRFEVVGAKKGYSLYGEELANG